MEREEHTKSAEDASDSEDQGKHSSSISRQPSEASCYATEDEEEARIQMTRA